MPGKGKMQITGKLGDVMQDLLKLLNHLLDLGVDYGIIPPVFDKKDSYSRA